LLKIASFLRICHKAEIRYLVACHKAKNLNVQLILNLFCRRTMRIFANNHNDHRTVYKNGNILFG
jgi:hypothetical protein